MRVVVVGSGRGWTMLSLKMLLTGAGGVRKMVDNDEVATDLEGHGEIRGSLLLAQLLAGLGQGGEEHVVPGGQQDRMDGQKVQYV